MEKNGEMAWGVIKTMPGLVSTMWLWLSNHDGAWWVSVLTVVYIVSQLIWGWSKFLGRKQA